MRQYQAGVKLIQGPQTKKQLKPRIDENRRVRFV